MAASPGTTSGTAPPGASPAPERAPIVKFRGDLRLPLQTGETSLKLLYFALVVLPALCGWFGLIGIVEWLGR